MKSPETQQIVLTPATQIIANVQLKYQKFAIMQRGILFVSPAIFVLMADEDTNRVLMKSMPIMMATPRQGIREIFEDAYKILGGGKLELKQEIIYNSTMVVVDTKYDIRTLRTTDAPNGVDLLEHQVDLGSHTEPRWTAIHSEFISEQFRLIFYFTMGNELINEKVYGVKHEPGAR